MKVLLLKDVYKLGRAGDVKKVANGYGRNYLIPHGMAVLATKGAVKQSERIRKQAKKEREMLNEEMSGLAEQMKDITLTFPVRASETGRLYGSVNTRMIAEALSEELEAEISHRQVDAQPLRIIGHHAVPIRLTVDVIPEIDVVVFREGETPEAALEEAEELVEAVERGEIDLDEKPEFDYELEEEEPTEVEEDVEGESEAISETEGEAEPTPEA